VVEVLFEFWLGVESVGFVDYYMGYLKEFGWKYGDVEDEGEDKDKGDDEGEERTKPSRKAMTHMEEDLFRS
jgi:hypothetical protein